MSGIGNQNFFARIALGLQMGADEQNAGHFAVRAGRGLQRDGVESGDLQQII